MIRSDQMVDINAKKRKLDAIRNETHVAEVDGINRDYDRNNDRDNHRDNDCSVGIDSLNDEAIRLKSSIR